MSRASRGEVWDTENVVHGGEMGRKSLLRKSEKKKYSGYLLLRVCWAVGVQWGNEQPLICEKTFALFRHIITASYSHRPWWEVIEKCVCVWPNCMRGRRRYSTQDTDEVVSKLNQFPKRISLTLAKVRQHHYCSESGVDLCYKSNFIRYNYNGWYTVSSVQPIPVNELNLIFILPATWSLFEWKETKC